MVGRCAEWMRFFCQCRERLGDFVDVGSYIGRRSAGIVLAVVSGVRAGDGEAEVTFDPGERRVAQPVGADLLDGHPWNVLAEPGPQVVIPASSDGSAVAVAQKLPLRV